MSSITRSNPNAFIPIQLSSHPQPDGSQHITPTGLYLSEQLSDEDSWSEEDTPTPKTTQWSDATLTGRSSFCSWGEDEGVLDRLNCETVGYMFDSIDRALYDNCLTGNEQVDSECKEWNTHFPHFRVTGVHLLDSMEDGTEIVDPLLTDEFDNGATKNDQPVTLCIKGCSLIPLPSPNITTGSPPNDNPGLHYEEIISSDGVVEEYFAYSDDSEEGKDSRKVSHRHRSRHLPPVTPSECIRDTVFSIVFDQLWSEVANVLHPLLLKHQSLKKQHKTFSQAVISPTNYIQVHNFYLPSNAELPPPTRSGHPVSLSLKRKPLTSGLLGSTPISHTTDLPNLQKVMTIKPVPLQHRIPSSSLPPCSNLLSTSGTGSMLFHDSLRPLLNLRHIPSAQTPLPPHVSDQKLIPGKIGNRRNPLKPIEISRTPAPMLEVDIRDFNGLIGQRLVRHTQLPPLDKTQLDNNKLPKNSGMKGRVTFSNRIVSAAVEDDETTGRYFQRQITANPSETRPNTTQTFRSETPLVRKSSNHSTGTSISPIKIIGHAASIHNDLVLWEEQEEGPPDTMQHAAFASPKQRSVLTRSKTSRNQIK